MPDQLSFELPILTSLGRDAFFVSEANAQAISVLDNPGTWPQSKMLLMGPKGSGKTHLARIWQGEQQANIFNPTQHFELPPADAPLLIEDIDHLAGKPEFETHLFHAHNFAQNNGLALLMTTSVPIVQAGFRLPDLLSRLSATAVTRINPPDDALLRAVVTKHFMDRQLAPSPAVQKYLLKHMERSFVAAAQTVAELDRLALTRGTPISRAIVAEVLGL